VDARIGFIEGGAILKGESTVKGTAPAAGIWNTGAIGIAVNLTPDFFLSSIKLSFKSEDGKISQQKDGDEEEQQPEIQLCCRLTQANDW
jgi:hypothetical protein